MIYVHACGNNEGRTHYLRYQECHLVFCGMWRWSGCDICHSRLILPLSRLGGISFLHKHFVCNPLGTSSLVAQLSMPGKRSYPCSTSLLLYLPCPTDCQIFSIIFPYCLHNMFTFFHPFCLFHPIIPILWVLKRPLFLLSNWNKECSF